MFTFTFCGLLTSQSEQLPSAFYLYHRLIELDGLVTRFAFHSLTCNCAIISAYLFKLLFAQNAFLHLAELDVAEFLQQDGLFMNLVGFAIPCYFRLSVLGCFCPLTPRLPPEPLTVLASKTMCKTTSAYHVTSAAMISSFPAFCSLRS